jgi:hypothetical protein
MDCELVGHMAPEADCRIYLGLVKAIGVVKNQEDPLTFNVMESIEEMVGSKKIYAN